MAGKYPPQIKYIIGNEGIERYSFYGMRSILVIFMVQYLMMDKAESTTLYHLFAGACYLIPVLGAYLSDRFLGKYKTILSLSLVYCLGNVLLACMGMDMDTGSRQTLLYWGLGLVALGTGGIKPCVSAFVGDQFKKDQEEELRQVFNLFYFMINFGSFFATLITPWVLPRYGATWAFGIPAALMFVATFIFWLGRKYYVDVPPTGKNPHSTTAIFLSALKNKKAGQRFFDGAIADHGENNVEGVRAVLAVGKTFLAISVFWALFDQHGSTWILQARDMELNFMGMPLLPSQIPALNPIMVMLLIPFFSKIVYPGIEKLKGSAFTPLQKMGTGMVVAGFSFALVGIFQYFLDSGVKLNVAWQFFPFLIITIAEVLISITGLEFAYTQAPRSMKSTLMSFWLLTVFLGNMLAATISKINIFSGGNFFMFYAALMIVVALIFAWIAKNYKMRNFIED